MMLIAISEHKLVASMEFVAIFSLKILKKLCILVHINLG